jgi:hypothetical protein
MKLSKNQLPHKMQGAHRPKKKISTLDISQTLAQSEEYSTEMANTNEIGGLWHLSLPYLNSILIYSAALGTQSLNHGTCEKQPITQVETNWI